jgi:membrane protein DedA with SNARE-associated domain
LTLHLQSFVQHEGYLALFILMVLESTCIPIPSEAIVPYAGYLSHQGQLNLLSVILVATVANVVGGYIAYLIGHYGGRAFVLKYGRFVLLNRHHLERAENWFQRYGEITVFVGRLVPAVRTFVSLPAGIANMKLSKFLLYSFLGSLPWNIALAIAGEELAAHWTVIANHLKPMSVIGAVVLVLLVFWFWFGRRTIGARRRP